MTRVGIRLQPRELEVPTNDPFKNDLIGRQEPVDVLTHLVGSIEGPCVLAVDAAWGVGKTTFLRIWTQYLRNQDFPVVQFNAWETDFTDDPFVALSGELISGLGQYDNSSLAEKIRQVNGAAKEIVRRAAPALIRLATAGVLDVNPLLEKEVGHRLASYAEERVSSYRKEQESVRAFRAKLRDMASALAESKDSKPLIVVIDELDRCRPSYAVELLEVAKHLFMVDHIVFVLAVNRTELAHSIRALYGSGFDAQGYLRRFFDVDFQLSDVGRKRFIEATLDTIQLNEYVRRTRDSMAQQWHDTVKTLLLAFFDVPDLSLRRISQAIHRLGLVFATMPSDRLSFVLATVVALIMRTVDADLYYKFIRGDASDLDVVDKLFDRPGVRTIRHQRAGHVFEASLIVAAEEDTFEMSMPSTSLSSPLLYRYQGLVAADDADQASSTPDVKSALAVIGWVDHLKRDIVTGRSRFGFKHSVQRIELLSKDLMDEAAASPENS